ncbi:glutamine synthetase type III [Pseudoprevotella muciniphila]|uniref:Glutamine synthetase type III n=1 Tax=Pseudoprevotella muciniphila TaxID=2133944 RepID=A0A5P8E948_9BACT|nr:glutamine synthetase III [Pseudoprevotella muciniphila]QFQ13472.1 glutamine synthetase type III [Pseudoprevotella muciniphila]
MTSLRFKAVEAASKKRPLEVAVPSERPSEYYAKYVFNQEKMFKYLPLSTYTKLREAIDEGTPLTMEVANEVADGMKRWAIENGVTHCTHWFQPLTEGTAEKHDAFVEHDRKGGMIENFSGKELIQQEPDASSFPNGGIRSTFEARGYSAWDPSSPVFIIGDTLMIPTVFISYTGEALDYKAPLKKALAALDKAATAVAQYFYPNVTKVTANLGWEQEYFLVDEDLYGARPDLMLTGRTLMGHDSAKNQQMNDHYFGAIPERVAEFMKDLEIQALELGIPCKTRHNEVAPNQFELAPIFEECSLAVDHNMLLMSLMRKIAKKHGFHCLLHEKPFAGINGSGKHNNWSLTTDTGTLLHGPGKTPEDNLRFAVFIVESLMAVYKHNGLLKASIISASNAHRLGANEAPPAIISAFLGRQITEILRKIEESTTEELFNIEGRHGIKLDIPQIPEIMVDNTDRNRTSPFAFTGNRFEFRAVGSSANCAAAMIVLNTAMAEALTLFKQRVDALIEGGQSIIGAVLDVLREDIKACKPIVFEGNGYSDEWKEEANRRGLDCETSVPLIIDRYLLPSSIKMFEDMNVMHKNELEARDEIKWETYQKRIQIESRVLGDLCMNHIIPVATKYQTVLVDNVQKIQSAFSTEDAKRLTSYNIDLIEKINVHTNTIAEQADKMVEARKQANLIENIREKAIAYHDNIVPYLEEIRRHIDKLELIVEDEMWTLPKYRELLFIR